MTKEANTLFQRAIEADDDERGGRYAAARSRPATIGKDEPVLAVPEWSREVVGLEPPTGELIDAVPDLGLASAPTPPLAAPNSVAPLSSAEADERGGGVNFSEEDQR